MFRVAAILFALMPTFADAELLLTEDEISATLAHGPWPPPLQNDPSNRVSGDPAAIDLGRKLFFDPILSRDGTLSCATCHDPDLEFGDGLSHATGRVALQRNTPSLWNVRFQRWFGWAGDTDNLWAQSLTPIVNAEEMDHVAEGLKTAVMRSSHHALYTHVFGALGPQSAELVLVNISKALAAYQETLVTGSTSFDDFRNALERDDRNAAATYPEAAQRGLKLFLGRGNCTICHVGPMFSNGEFHDAGVPYFTSATGVDTGRFGGLQSLFESPYTLAGEYSDDPNKSGAWAVRNVRQLHSDFGTFRVPSLRNVALTAPYMHNGSLANLEDVVRHYDQIDLERLHADGEAILRPLNLADQEVMDLVAFLETLTASSRLRP